jgi:ADP-heptose:LPS heptosyltransferase
MLTWLAEIPRRVAYCRENPYGLLTDWVPELEPYSILRHQVERDLQLVKTLGAKTSDDRLRININDTHLKEVEKKLLEEGVDVRKPWLVLHPGVSEEKRQYPAELWIETGKKIIKNLDQQILVTGSESESTLSRKIAQSIGPGAFSCGGLFTLQEFIALIKKSPLVISVNTSTAHIAAATQTKIIVLYALTNPQHAPWRANGKILPFSVRRELHSKNEVLKFLNNKLFSEHIPLPAPNEVVEACATLLESKKPMIIPPLVIPSTVAAVV